MGKINNEIFKSSFSKANVAEYKLSILFGMDSLSYYVSDAKELLVLKKIDFDTSNKHTSLARHLDNTWLEEPTLSLPYRTVQVAFVGPHYTIIPNRLYSEPDKAQYLLPLKRPAIVSENIFSDALPSIDSQLIYSLPTDVEVFLKTTYDGKAQLHHCFSSLIEIYSKRAGTGKEVFLNIRNHTVDAFFFDNKELIFSNQFSFQSDKDFLYYILLLFDKFQLNQMEVPVTVSGTLAADSTIYSQLYKYIQYLYFIDLPTAFSQDTDLQKYPAHLFFDVLHTA